MLTLFAPTARGLEQVTAREVTEIGGIEPRIVAGGVRFSGDTEVLYRANLWLRTASRVLVEEVHFSIEGRDDLHAKTTEVAWEALIGAGKTFAVHCVFVGRPEIEDLRHTHYTALKVKDGIVDRMMSVLGERPSVDANHPDVQINVVIEGHDCTISRDSTARGLHERGYRLATGPAPLKETLAAGLVLLTGWDGRSAFIDPMCGAGTLCVEAALIGLNIAPGSLNPTFGFQRWADYDEALFKRLLDEARGQRKRSLPYPIRGYDGDAGAIKAAKENTARVDLFGDVIFEQRALGDLKIPASAAGVMVTNPPYGERMGSRESATATAKLLGDLMKQRLTGWQAYVLAGNAEMMKAIGLRTSARIPVFNGAIECRLLKYDLSEGTKRGGGG